MPTTCLRGHAIAGLFAALALVGSARVGAQSLPTEPIVVGGGRVTIAGDVSITYSCARGDTLSACAPDEGYFNLSSYDNSLFRNFRVNITAAVKASDRVSVLSEVRSDNLHRPQPYALYVRLRPWPRRRLDVQAGRIPPAFGAFSRRPYPADNVLIGYPLAYQYLTSLRADALPADADELIRMRGRGWLSNFTVGDPSARNGLPLIDGLRWDTGVQVHAATDLVQGTVAVTTGTLSDPRVRDNNGGRQLSGRLALQPAAGLALGASASRGPYAARETALSAGLAGDDSTLTQSAWGADAEYSRGHYLLRGEAVWSEWRVPIIRTPAIDEPLRALALTIEGRHTLRPGLYVAARWDRLTFSELSGSTSRNTWEASVTRVEAGLGYSVRRNVLIKMVYQHNARDGGRIPVVSLGGAQLVYWF